MAITLNGTTGITTPDVNVTAQSSNIVTTGNITAVDATLSGGVYVGGTAAANHLDDYEEGEWTVVNRSIVPLTITNSPPTARYIKIGRLVFINMYISYPVTTDTNQAKINLPFTSVGYSYIVGRFQGSAANGFVLQTGNGNDEAIFHSATNSVSLTNQTLSGSYVLISGCFIANT